MKKVRGGVTIGKEEKKDFDKHINEFEEAHREFFKDRDKPTTEEEELKQQQEFVRWYNEERKQSDTGLTPVEMGDRLFEFSIDDPEEDTLREAAMYLEEGMFKKARERIEEILESRPGDVSALSLLAQSHILTRNQKEARDTLDRWEKIDQKDPYLLFNKAQYHLMDLNLNRSLEHLDELLEREPDFFEGLLMKAQILSLMGDEGYEEIIGRARDIDEELTDDFLESHWTDGVLDPGEFFFSEIEEIDHLIESGKTEEARAMISEIKDTGFSQESDEIFKRLELESFMQEGKEEEVEKRVKRWLRDDPEDLAALNYSAILSYSSGDLEKALETIDKVISTEEEDFDVSVGHFGSYMFKSEILKAMGDEGWKEWEEKADDTLNRYLETMVEKFGEEVLPLVKKDEFTSKRSSERKEKRLDEFLDEDQKSSRLTKGWVAREFDEGSWFLDMPKEAEAAYPLFDKCVEHIDEGELKEAVMCLKRVLDDSPNHIESMSLLAYLYADKGKIMKAIELWKKGVDIGRSALSHGFRKGDTLEWSMIENRPFLRCLENLGLTYLNLGEVDKALPLFQEIIGYNPNDNQGVREVLVDIYLTKRRYDDVIKISEMYPKDGMPAIAYGRALALFKTGQKEKATEDLKEAVRFLPKVAEELMKDEHEEPGRVIPGTVSFGGWDQAYDYWDHFGGHWGKKELKWLKNVYVDSKG
ncbi:MAG: tetratricopeptide repeat protein [Thermoplasmata archaeon]